MGLASSLVILLQRITTLIDPFSKPPNNTMELPGKAGKPTTASKEQDLANPCGQRGKDCPLFSYITKSAQSCSTIIFSNGSFLPGQRGRRHLSRLVDTL